MFSVCGHADVLGIIFSSEISSTWFMRSVFKHVYIAPVITGMGFHL